MLKARPLDEVSDACFEWRHAPVPTPGPGEALVRVVWLSIEPTQRVASHSARLCVGDWVTGMTDMGHAC